MFEIRAMTVEDISRLSEIDPNFVGDSVLEVQKSGRGMEVTWTLLERRLVKPYDKGRRYDLLESDLADIRRRLEMGKGLELVAVDAGGIIGMLDLALETWNNTAHLWFILVDRAHRGRGVGRQMFERAIEYARRQGVRAITIETQSNNVPACRYYAAIGCELAGLNDQFYSNEDLEVGEVALFWAFRVDDISGTLEAIDLP